ncbi:DUF4301 family protein [Thermodesulfobacteriota bacterium]
MKESLFTSKDMKHMKSRGIDPERLLEQIDTFKKGHPYLKLVRPCTLGDGITSIPDADLKYYVKLFNQRASNYTVSVFVPASGAASRMFKVLLKFHNENLPPFPLKDNALQEDKDIKHLSNFLDNVESFAFYEDLIFSAADDGLNLNKLDHKDRARTILDYLLSEKGLDYSNLPKGLLKFHKYPERSRTSFGEHLVEASGYCTDLEGLCRLHFTVSPEHRDRFTSLFKKLRDDFENKFGVRFQVEFTVQEGSTDTIAVDLKNRPFRLEDGTLFFRPGGHGALIENLGRVEGDIVFIKNIDNVVPDRLKDKTLFWKKILGGVFISVQERLFNYLEKLASGPLDEDLVNEIQEFSTNQFSITIPSGHGSGPLKEKQDMLFGALNRPLRVCGMVKNQGEPGGGPFWVESEGVNLSIQIVEKAQIDPDSEEQLKILAASTHFNPVDIVCGIKDFRGKRFDLKKFVDHDAVFISQKSKGGRELKALELPGLWNGAMAFWNTVFVEVPLLTFNPVKTVNDLLREEHR